MQYTKLTFYLLLALPTALASISLENIETLDPTKVNSGCFNSYNHEIDECTMSELSSGNCSSNCISALKSFASTVILACRQASPDNGTLLKKIDNGELVDTLCKKTTDSQRDAATTTNTAITTSSAIEGTFHETVTSTLDARATESYTMETTSETNTIETTSESNTASATGARTSDDTILGNSDNAAPNVGMGMGVIMAVAIAAIVAVL